MLLSFYPAVNKGCKTNKIRLID